MLGLDGVASVFDQFGLCGQGLPLPKVGIDARQFAGFFAPRDTSVSSARGSFQAFARRQQF